jgi:hypothetical protein
MRSKLPCYVVESFIASGFDTLDVICQMDVTTNEGNSLDVIKKFIEKEYPGDARFSHDDTSGSTFTFLPRHHIRITNFVNDMVK